MNTIDATDIKARCLAVLDRIQAAGKRPVLLKRSRPLAELSSIGSAAGEFPQSGLMGTVTAVGDVVSSAVPEEQWDSLKTC